MPLIMRSLAFLVCLTVSLAADDTHAEEGKRWALLVSSANTWINYGMQADVYHAYWLFREGGIPEEQIIVMAFDDIVNNDKNPFKGQVFESYDLEDVYKGIRIDYRRESVNKDVFLSVLRGDKDAVKRLTDSDGKVIDSGPSDNVFVFVSDHGAPGYIAWYDNNFLSAKELNQTIASMHEENRYKNLVLYVDTCFAGSMFKDTLPNNIGVYAATATNATFYAYSSECHSRVFGKAATCLGGLFSTNWAYEAQSDNRFSSTMNMQFQGAKSACQGATTPMQYGDISIAHMTQKEFFGDSVLNRNILRRSRPRRSVERASVIRKNMLAYQTLKNQLAALPKGSRGAQRLMARVSSVEKLMGLADKFFLDTYTSVHGRLATNSSTTWAETNFGVIKWSCYEPVVKAVMSLCPKMMRTEEVRYYAGSKFGVLVNLCNQISTAKVLAALKRAAEINSLCAV